MQLWFRSITEQDYCFCWLQFGIDLTVVSIFQATEPSIEYLM
jgi:hypothetical protein